MKHCSEYFFCSPRLLKNIDEIKEIYTAINSIKWEPSYRIEHGGKLYEHQSAYNKAFELEFSKYECELKPLLHDNPRLIGDFRKNDVFVEVQFGNSSTLYRDYYKFHYGLTHNLLSLSVLNVPLPIRWGTLVELCMYKCTVCFIEEEARRRISQNYDRFSKHSYCNWNEDGDSWRLILRRNSAPSHRKSPSPSQKKSS